MHLYLKVDKRQLKCHRNCVNGMSEGRVSMRCMSIHQNYITTEDFNPRGKSGERDLTSCHSGHGPRGGQTVPGVGVREMCEMYKTVMLKVSMTPEENESGV